MRPKRPSRAARNTQVNILSGRLTLTLSRTGLTLYDLRGGFLENAKVKLSIIWLRPSGNEELPMQWTSGANKLHLVFQGV